MTTTYDPIKPLPDECRCGGGFPPCPSGGGTWGSWIPGWMVAQVQAGKTLVSDPKTTRCLQAVVEYIEGHKPSKILYRGLPQNFVDLSKEWDDPIKRSALLEKMAKATVPQMEAYFSDHMDDHWNVRLWLARFKAYMNAVEQISLHNHVMEKDPIAGTDIFYSKF